MSGASRPADQREPRGGPERVGRIGGEGLAEGLGGGLAPPQPLARVAEREQRRRPVRGALQRLLEQIRGGRKVAVPGRRPAVTVAAVGDQVAAGEEVLGDGHGSLGEGRRPSSPIAPSPGNGLGFGPKSPRSRSAADDPGAC